MARRHEGKGRDRERVREEVWKKDRLVGIEVETRGEMKEVIKIERKN